MRVTSMISPNGNAIANQFELKINGGFIFQSYQSLVALWINNKKVINKTYYKYSNTTTKYTVVFFELNSAKELHNDVKSGDIELVNQEEFDRLLAELK